MEINDVKSMNLINPYVLGVGKGKILRQSGNKTYKPRRSVWYEIMLVLKGEGFVINDGEKIMTDEGTIIFRHPGMITDVYPPYERYIVIFDLYYDETKKDIYGYYKGIKDLFAHPKLEVGSYTHPFFTGYMKTKNKFFYENIFENMFSAFVRDGIEDQFYLKSNLMYLLANIFSERQNEIETIKNKSFQNNLQKVEKVKRYIKEHYEEELSLDSLAYVAGVSKEFLCAIFRKTQQKTVVGYINEYRIEIAKRKLIETDDIIEKIALECGYHNSNYFYKEFRKKQGMTPQSYRIYNRF